jgi:hypothetical protein
MRRSRHRLGRGALIVLALTGLVAGTVRPAAATTAGSSSDFTLIGHNALYNRGMNAAITLYGDYVYIGSRTDSGPTHLHPGVLVVDASKPATPKVVNEISALSVDPLLELDYTSRELRVWPQQKLLIVIYMSCSTILHACLGKGDVGGPENEQEMAFFDLTNPASPKLVHIYKPSVMPHEMFLWVDPANPGGRALMYWTSPNSFPDASLVVTDISDWRNGHFKELTRFDITGQYSAADTQPCPLPDDHTTPCFDVRLHSISLSPDGTVMYMAHLGGGFLMADTSQLAAGSTSPKIKLITPVANRVKWDNQGAHSAVRIPGKPYVLTTEEIYGTDGVFNIAFGRALGGCPWGWVRIIDISTPTAPHIVSEFKIDKNQQSSCVSATSPAFLNVAAENNYSSYASHNPTVFPDVALVTWHSGGLRAIDLSDPTKPTSAGYYLPTPEPFSVTPDPALEPGSDKVIAWSYPIVRNGLIYFIDIRNGLYIVKYTGRHKEEVDATAFYEGNSNVGDAARINGSPAAHPQLTRNASGLPSRLPDTAPRLPARGGPIAAAGVVALAAGLMLRRRRQLPDGASPAGSGAV